jgi:uncharacterized protein (DUF2141 family)
MKKYSFYLLFVSVLGGLLITLAATAASSSRLTVEVSGLRNEEGMVCLSLFSNEEGFPSSSDRAVFSRCIEAGEASSVTFDQLASGRYSVAVIHDANQDDKLNTGFLGIPTEGFGFSRNPRIGTSAPSFSDTAILVSGESTIIKINLKYIS